MFNIIVYVTRPKGNQIAKMQKQQLKKRHNVLHTVRLFYYEYFYVAI